MTHRHDGPNADALIPCVAAALNAARAARAEALNPFPELPVAQPTPDELKALLSAAAKWASSVISAYESVCELFASSHREQHYIDFVGGNPFAMDPNSVARLSSFPVHISTSPEWPRLDKAIHVLGPLPAQYQQSCAQLLVRFGDDGYFTPARPTEDDRRLKIAPENWAAIRDTLRTTYLTALTKCLGLAAWIEEQVAHFEHAVMPQIDIREDIHKSQTTVVVRHSGSSRCLTLGSVISDFLRALGEKGVATGARTTKRRLIEKIPELAPWIQPISGREAPVEEPDAIYEIDPDVKRRIVFQRNAE